jgi:hypothetical protein
MKARLLQKSRDEFLDGIIVETVIWELPEVLPERPHCLKYRLYCGRNGECIVRYDNEIGKGDHRHYGDNEESYSFVSFAKLIDDFLADVERLTGVRV